MTFKWKKMKKKTLAIPLSLMEWDINIMIFFKYIIFN